MPKKWFEVWAYEKTQNALLKTILMLVFPLVLIQAITLFIILNQSALETTKQQLERKVSSDVGDQARAGIRTYMETRYNWSSGQADKAIASSLRWIKAENQQQYVAVSAAQVKVAAQRSIGQKFFVTHIKVDSVSKSAEVEGERILIVGNLRASNTQRFRINFETNEPSKNNPEGIYVTSEAALSP